jgi:hypothetical protein
MEYGIRNYSVKVWRDPATRELWCTAVTDIMDLDPSDRGDSPPLCVTSLSAPLPVVYLDDEDDEDDEEEEESADEDPGLNEGETNDGDDDDEGDEEDEEEGED